MEFVLQKGATVLPACNMMLVGASENYLRPSTQICAADIDAGAPIGVLVSTDVQRTQSEFVDLAIPCTCMTATRSDDCCCMSIDYWVSLHLKTFALLAALQRLKRRSGSESRRRASQTSRKSFLRCDRRSVSMVTTCTRHAVPTHTRMLTQALLPWIDVNRASG
jgi:hypothetical protein